MSARQAQPDDRLAPSSEYELYGLVDDEEDPSELTIFPATGGGVSTTEWITADIESTVSLAERR